MIIMEFTLELFAHAAILILVYNGFKGLLVAILAKVVYNMPKFSEKLKTQMLKKHLEKIDEL